MQKFLVFVLKAIKKVYYIILIPLDWVITFFILYANSVKFSSFRSQGLPKINVGLGGKCSIGLNFKMNSRESSNPIGRFHRCSIIVGNEGNLIIGQNVGMSSASIVCHKQIEIGDNVKIGGNVVIYDTDFHSLNHRDRVDLITDRQGTKKNKVKIGNNVFIGAHSTILKGVTIGDNAIIGACSVVTKSIPSNEIWAGNPARFIKTTFIGN